MKTTAANRFWLGVVSIVALLAMGCGDSSNCPTLSNPPTPPVSIGSPCDSNSQCSDPDGLFMGECKPQEDIGCVCTAVSN